MTRTTTGGWAGSAFRGGRPLSVASQPPPTGNQQAPQLSPSHTPLPCVACRDSIDRGGAEGEEIDPEEWEGEVGSGGGGGGSTGDDEGDDE
jgi:hypothetical protein